MKRREFITLLGGAAAASSLSWPLPLSAQQPAMPVIGFLHGGSPEPNVKNVAAFRQGLSEAGFVEGRNLAIEFRWAAGHDDRLPELAAELIRRRVAVIATPLSTQAALAAKAATATIPIVFGSGGDPVALGLVASFNRPGGNVTGISFMTAEIGAKVLGQLHELVPRATRFVALANPNSSLTEAFIKDLQTGARTLGLQVEVLSAGSEHEIDAAFATAVQKRADALLIAPDALFTSRRAQLAALSVRHALPSAHVIREFAEAGGLMSYGPNLAIAYQQTGSYTGRILKGEKPADLPVAQPTKFELVINLKTAKALGLDIPDKLLALADEVIE
jgi:putative tryptophan/tyrosine transport system substrate-binding protein